MILRKLTDWPAWGRRSSFEELERMRKQMDRLAGGLGGSVFREPAAGVFPLMNVSEDNDSYYARAELPGIKTDELDISVTGDSLTISGERKIRSENENANYHRREREAGNFSRVLSLPGQINTSKVEASSADGVLTIVLPKSEAAKPQQITIKTS